MRRWVATSSEVIQVGLEIGELKEGRSPDLRELRFFTDGIGLWFQHHLGLWVAPGMPRRSKVHPPARVLLNEGELEQARMLARVAIRLQVRTEAAELLAEGADPEHLHDLRVSTTTSLCGASVAQERWGASSPEACRQAQKRVRAAGLVDGALYLSVLYDVAKTAPPPLYLSGGSGLGEPGLAWAPSSGVDPSILVKRHPEPEQMVLWDLDETPWTYWSEARMMEE